MVPTINFSSKGCANNLREGQTNFHRYSVTGDSDMMCKSFCRVKSVTVIFPVQIASALVPESGASRQQTVT